MINTQHSYWAFKVGVESWKLWNHVVRGHFLFTSSDTSAAGCIV